MVNEYTFLIPLIGMPLGAVAAAKVSLYFAEKKRLKNLRDMHYFWYGDEDMP